MTTKDLTLLRTRYAPLAAPCLALILAGCAGTEAPSDTTPSQPDVESTEQPTVASWEDETDPATRLAGCIVGSWHMDNSLMEAEYVRVMGSTGLSDVTATVSGELAVNFADDESYVLTAEASRTATEGVAQGDAVSFVLEHSGTESGGWSAESGALTLDGQDQSGITTATEFAVGGVEMPSGSLPLPTTPWSGTVEAECDVDRLVLVQHDSGESMTVEFIRAT